MNERTGEGIQEYARALMEGGVSRGAMIAPAGAAFALVYDDDVSSSSVVSHYSLYDADGTHPSVLGSYLVACLYYELFFDRSPVGVTFRPNGVGEDEAKYLQSIAATALEKEESSPQHPSETSNNNNINDDNAYYCGCETCTEEVWNTRAQDSSGNFRCGGRIEWVQTSKEMTESEACRVVSAEFPTICGAACHPDRCG